MKQFLHRLLKDTFVWDLRQNRIQGAAAEKWRAAGKPVPPPEFVKRTTLAEYGSAFGITTLVETGTFLGDAIYTLRRRFKNLYSIELSHRLAEDAVVRFRNYPHIHVMQGDSAEVLPQLLSSIADPCVFWLDGHYSGGITAQAGLDTPILKELRSVMDHSCKSHVILIDDARLFNGTSDYPTVETLQRFFKEERPQYDFYVLNDMICAHPAKQITTTF